MSNHPLTNFNIDKLVRKLIRNPIKHILRLNRLSNINPIQQNPIRRPIIQRLAQLCLRTNAARSRNGICGIGSRFVGDVDTQNVEVEEVVDNVHAAIGAGSRRSVDAAVVECCVGDIVGSFEVVGKFVEDIWDGGHVGVVVYFNQYSFFILSYAHIRKKRGYYPRR